MTLPARLCSATLGVAFLLVGCANSTVGVPPPGEPGGGPAVLFFPAVLAVDPCGDRLYIANSNFDRAFNSGTLVSISTSLFDTPPGQLNIPFPTDPARYTSDLLDSFAGNMVVSADVTATTVPVCGAGMPGPTGRLYVTSRDHSLLNSAFIGSDGLLQCTNGNCSADAVPLSGAPSNSLEPFALNLATTILPGGTTSQKVVLVSSLVQAPTSQDGIGLDTTVAVIPAPSPNSPPPASSATAAATPFSQVAYAVDIGQPASNSIAVGPNNTIYVGGCFQLVPGGSTVPCPINTNDLVFSHLNPLRTFVLGAGPQAPVTTIGMGTLVGTVTTGGGLITALDMSSDGTSLYVAMQNPNALLVTTPPPPNLAVPPAVRAIIPLSNTPQQMLVMKRNTPAGGDLIAVSATESNALLIVDPVLGTVVSQVEPVGREPFGLAAIPLTTPVVGHRVFVALFGDCGVAAVDVPDAAPEQASLRSVVGTSCATSTQQVLFGGTL